MLRGIAIVGIHVVLRAVLSIIYLNDYGHVSFCNAFGSSISSISASANTIYDPYIRLDVLGRGLSNSALAVSNLDEEWSRDLNTTLVSSTQTASDYATYLRNLKEIIASPRSDLNVTRAGIMKNASKEGMLLPNVRIKRYDLMGQNQSNTNSDDPSSNSSNPGINEIDDSFVYALCGMDEVCFQK